MILVLGGTTEAKEMGVLLQDKGLKVILTTVSSYGEQLAAEAGITRVHSGPLDQEQLEELIRQENIEKVVDATHPYARIVSQNAIKACCRLKIPYCRYERPAAALPNHPLLITAEDYRQAVKIIPALGNRVFLTIGSKNLSLFAGALEMQGLHLIARVLPEVDSLRCCRQLGLKPDQIVALQGPFSAEANRWMFGHFKADLVVSKESGKPGGFSTKWQACRELNIPLLVISRPRVDYPLMLTVPEKVAEFCLQK